MFAFPPSTNQLSDLPVILESPLPSPPTPPPRPLPSPPAQSVDLPVREGGSLPVPLRTTGRKAVPRLVQQEEKEEEKEGDGEGSALGLIVTATGTGSITPPSNKKGMMSWFSATPSPSSTSQPPQSQPATPSPPRSVSHPRTRTLSGSSTPPLIPSSKSSPATITPSLPAPYHLPHNNPETNANANPTTHPDPGPSFSRPPQSASAALTLLRQYSPAVASFVEAHHIRPISRPSTPTGRGRFLSTPTPIRTAQEGEGEEGRIRVSGTFGVGDEVDPGSARLGGVVGVEAQGFLEGEGTNVDVKRPGTPIPSVDPVPHFATRPSMDSSSPPSPTDPEPIIPRRASLIVDSRDGLSLARDLPPSSSLPAPSDPSSRETRSDSLELLRDIFPGSEDWQSGESPTSGRTVFTHQPPAAGRGVTFPRAGGLEIGFGRIGGVRRSVTAPGRLPSLTESDVGEEARAELRALEGRGTGRRVEVEDEDEISPDPGFEAPGGPFPTSANGGTTPKRDDPLLLPASHPRASLPLLMASSILSSHAASLINTSTEQKRRSLQLRNMARESLEVGRMMLELAEAEEKNPSGAGGAEEAEVNNRGREEEERYREEAYAALVGRSSGVGARPFSTVSGAGERGSVISVGTNGVVSQEAIQKAEKLGKAAFGKMKEAEANWEEMMNVLKESSASTSSRGRRPSKLQKRNSSSPTTPTTPGIIKRPGEEGRRTRSRSSSPVKREQQVRFRDPEGRGKGRRRWWGLRGPRKVTVAPGED